MMRVPGSDKIRLLFASPSPAGTPSPSASDGMPRFSIGDPSSISDDLLIVEDSQKPPLPTGVTPPRVRPWRILVVDDDPDVHESTAFALKDVEMFGRPLVLLHAHSVAEAIALASTHEDIAVALIDVVMETQDAGLHLVERLREANCATLRIILRTGYPGQAPEYAVMSRYDINDYRTKDELTHSRLLSVLHTALRGYRQLSQIVDHRTGLRLVLQATADLFARTSVDWVAHGVLPHLGRLVGAPVIGVVALGPLGEPVFSPSAFTVVDALGGPFARAVDRPLSALPTFGTRIVGVFERASAGHAVVIDSDALGLMVSGHGRQALFVYLDITDRPPSGLDPDLLQVFATTLALCFNNANMIEHLDRLAYFDPVLEIPNRNAFERLLDSKMHEGSALRVIFVSITGLTEIAGVFGEGAATHVLIRIAHALGDENLRLQGVARYSETIFVALGDPDQIDEGALQRVLARPALLDGAPAPVSVFLAVVDVTPDMVDAQTVCRHGLSALLSTEGNRTRPTQPIRYTQDMTRILHRRLALRAALRRGLERDCGLEVHLQPKIDIATGSIVGAEALCRWTLEGRPVPPSEFIPLAETGGLSRPLTRLVLNHVAAIVARRRARGLPALPIAVNLSAMDLTADDFVTGLLRDIHHLDLSPDTLSFEITESQMMTDLARSIAELESIRAAGFDIALDDFGTGYSSLGVLDRLPVTAIKIDRRFITPLTIAGARRSLAATAIAMAEGLGLGVIAEGIETVEHHHALVFLGCPHGQGFLYGHPMPAGDFETHHTTWSLPTA
ncbi:EAL domain-containing protein [Pararhodospirillum oryzae]|uniref:Diguanylate cyclase n=1 Tax=Pararhodospirillum oryzae TaxID=478448 RepID=A0A512H9V6_9PROT|nr:EAL domain-containing protein [Pararhodospirillum oryzae]GEO82244.1 diguanylate cyclase [Pararhodospirillum oryzae]